MRFDLLLLGGVRYRLKGEEATKGLELLRKEGFSPKVAKRVKKTGDIRFYLSKNAARRLDALLPQQSIDIVKEREGGVPWLWQGLCKRPGLIVGMLIAILVFAGARLLLWDVRISGAEQIPEEELLAELGEVGLHPGALLLSLDRDEISLSLRREDARLSFVGINLKGTVAYVQVQESVREDKREGPRLPANLVAARDGVITLPLIFEGECLVAPGDVVRVGDILAGGLIDTQNHGYRVTRAAGQVMAKTTHEFYVSVPFSYVEKQPIGERLCGFSMLFFNFEQKLFKSTGNPIDKCDIIREIIWLTTPSGKRLPFGYSKTVAAAYIEEGCRRDARSARQMAQSLLERQIATECAGCTLLQKSTEVVLTGDGIELFCRVICEEDIAATSEFTVQP